MCVSKSILRPSIKSLVSESAKSFTGLIFTSYDSKCACGLGLADNPGLNNSYDIIGRFDLMDE